MENNSIKMFIKNEGELFYLKWRKDTIQSLTIAPIFFSFFALIFIMIVGVSMKLLFILVWPLILTIILFIYVPFFIRKKYINNMVKSILIKDNTIYLETFKWFNSDPLNESALITDLQITESMDISFFRGKSVYLLKIKSSESNVFYIINHFFDDINIVADLIK